MTLIFLLLFSCFFMFHEIVLKGKSGNEMLLFTIFFMFAGFSMFTMYYSLYLLFLRISGSLGWGFFGFDFFKRRRQKCGGQTSRLVILENAPQCQCSFTLRSSTGWLAKNLAQHTESATPFLFISHRSVDSIQSRIRSALLLNDLAQRHPKIFASSS